MKSKILICFLIISTGLTGTACFGQIKFFTWFRERIGQREARDAQQAKENSAWQQKHFEDAAAQEEFISAVKRASCNTCHIKGEKKEVRNPFGEELSQLLQKELEMDSEQIAAALKFNAPEETQQQVEAAFYKCLDEALTAKAKSDGNAAKTYGDHIKQGELPVTP